MKKNLALILAAAVAASAFTVSSYADEEYTEVTLVIDGEEVENDQPAVIVDSRTMVPVRVIAEALGVEVDWVSETKTATFEKSGLSAALTIGETSVSVTAAGVESEVEIDAPAVIINERTMVPVRFISELFSAEVEWAADTKTVTVTSSAAEDETEEEAAAETEAETEEEALEEEALEEEALEEADEAEEEAEEEVEETAESSYSSGTYYISASNDAEYIYEDMIFVDGVLIYEDFSNETEGKGSYGIYPGESEPYDRAIEYSPYYGMTMEEVIAALEANGLEVTVQ